VAPPSDLFHMDTFLKKNTIFKGNIMKLENRSTADIIEELKALQVRSNTYARMNAQFVLFVYICGHGVLDMSNSKTGLVGLDQKIIPVELMLDSCTMQKGVMTVALFQCCRERYTPPKT